METSYNHYMGTSRIKINSCSSSSGSWNQQQPSMGNQQQPGMGGPPPSMQEYQQQPMQGSACTLDRILPVLEDASSSSSSSSSNSSSNNPPSSAPRADALDILGLADKAASAVRRSESGTKGSCRRVHLRTLPLSKLLFQVPVLLALRFCSHGRLRSKGSEG
jgi:hypothetical protein